MKRSPLTRTTSLRRQVPVRRRNAKRLRRLHAKQFGPQAALARTLPCCVCNAPSPSDPHHVHSRGAGGDDSSVVPLCRFDHDAFHREGPSFWVRVGVDPQRVLARMRALVADAEQPDGLAVSPLLGSVAWR